MDIREIRVEVLEMKKAEYPDTLRSGGVGPCIAIAVYDPVTRSGYMMHEPHFQYTQLDKKIDRIREDYADLSRLNVFASGNSLTSDDLAQREFEKSNRVFVEKALENYFDSEKTKIEWMPDNYMSEVFLETLTGKMWVESVVVNPD